MPISSQRSFLRLMLVGLLACLLTPLASADEAKRLRIGITLHPYYSYVANIVGDKAEVVPLIPAGFNPHAYEPRAEDIKRISGLDVVVLNGVGHDDFADRMIAASETPKIPVIEANENVPLLAATGVAARGCRQGRKPAHLPVDQCLDCPGQQHRPGTGQARPGQRQDLHPERPRLRQTPAADARRRPGETDPGTERRTASSHGSRGLRLFAARIRPGSDGRGRTGARHRTEPEPAEKAIDQLRELDVKVIFSEMDFPSTYVDTIQRESGVKLYPLSHISMANTPPTSTKRK